MSTWQCYKFLIYNGGDNVFLSHPFPVDRLNYIKEWYESGEYQTIKGGNYTREGKGSVDVSPQSQNDVDSLKRQIEELQKEIQKTKSQSGKEN